jgi:hypothetical protein
MSCYIYCFCERPAPEIQQDSGVDGSPIRAVDREGIVAVIADSCGSPARSVENVIAHNRVVNSLLQFTTPIPCRFGTILSNRELEEYIAANGPELRTLMVKFRGCVEMALRITWNPEEDSPTDRRSPPVPPSDTAGSPIADEIELGSASVPLEPGGPGTRFLVEKLRQAASRDRANRRAHSILQWADSGFADLVRDRIARLRPETAMVADIAHLVERARLEQYRDLFRKMAAARADVCLSSSGAWAPYSFAVVDDCPRSPG